jgi:RecA-family ATPase
MTNSNQKLPSGNIQEADLEKDIIKNTRKQPSSDLLKVKEVNQWIEDAKMQPIPEKLVDCLWYQGELCILFADTNIGKSIFAVQIAEALTTCTSIPPFSKCEESKKVLYCDFEMSAKQFENRYSQDYHNHHIFSSNFYRAELDLDKYMNQSDTPLEEHIAKEISDYIILHEIDVVIIDNLTYMMREIEKSKNVQPLMQKLKWITKEYGISIMVLAHTPKRDSSRPITVSDIAGSKFISNFSDSIFALGKSNKNEEQRFLKQLKSRNSSIFYGDSNVILFSIEKQCNFLGFIHEGFDYESSHLRVKTNEDEIELENKIIELKKLSPDWSYRKIGEELACNHMKVSRILKKHSEN